MSLTKEIKSQTIVIIAENFNPSIFNQHWLIKNGFVEENQMKNYVFSNEVAQFYTDDYKFLVAQNQIQFSLTNHSKDLFLVLESFLIKVLQKLKEVPYKALGVNFDWVIKDNELSTKELTKKLFFNENSEFYSQFSNEQNSRFGSYISVDFENSRMKLDIRPAFINGETDNEILVFSFNFHVELNNREKYFEDLMSSLKGWKNYSNKAESIINILK
ncbi:MAG: hypothetical protein H6Q15_1686 [Bacteroidetes bacterium]|nr:hypothetical protein [Bacteroidota bacterium]